MTRRPHRGLPAWSVLGMLLAGCAPKGFEDGLNYYADQYHVRDAAARRSERYWYLRFNELILSDLDDAVRAGRQGNNDEMKRLGLQAIGAAASMAREVGAQEIDRLPAEGRRELARVTKTSETPQALKQAYWQQVDHASAALLAAMESEEASLGLRRLDEIRQGVEALPDDKGRVGRQLLFAWAALPAWLGVKAVDQTLEEKQAKPFTVFEHSMAFVPEKNSVNQEYARFGPVLVLETPAERNYPADLDRFGEVCLSGDPVHVDVHINTSKPTAYVYESQAKINDKRYRQLVYVWWFPERPSMTQDDPVAGRIDGDTLRITLSSRGRPAIFEVVQGCGCGHLVYVADDVERQARETFGGPLEGKELAVERIVQGRRDLIVSGTVTLPTETCHPWVFVEAGYHSVSGLQCADLPAYTPSGTTYAIGSYDLLDHLPLGDGFGSMFGPDGLVHNAGRKEGYLLAPTGMLSAGQPRKRGTQRIRWDEYNFEDPHLLERALRLPADF